LFATKFAFGDEWTFSIVTRALHSIIKIIKIICLLLCLILPRPLVARSSTHVVDAVCVCADGNEVSAWWDPFLAGNYHQSRGVNG
jgi:hypothetical protein